MTPGLQCHLSQLTPQRPGPARPVPKPQRPSPGLSQQAQRLVEFIPLCHVHQDAGKGKKGCWVLKFLIHAATKTHVLVGEKEVPEHSHLLMFSMSPCSVMMFRSPSISSRALWYLCAQSSLWWNISSSAADCTCGKQPRAKRLLPDQPQLSQRRPSAAQAPPSRRLQSQHQEQNTC